jgi:hypothetical protein
MTAGTRVIVKGEPGRPRDLKRGMRVRVAPGAKGEAETVEVLDASGVPPPAAQPHDVKR